MSIDIDVNFNPIFEDFNKTKARYRLAKGSAGSGKSVNVAQDFIIKLSDPKFKGANLVVVRKFDASNRHSTFAELTGSIRKIFGEYANDYWEILTSPLQITSKITGNQIIFRGMKDDAQREKVKSITFPEGKLTWVWIEEATELTEDDVDILDDRLRGKLDNPNLYYQITFTFNPVSATHWIKEKYFDYKEITNDPDIFTHHSTYRDNRFIDEAYYRRMERRKVQDPEGYRVYGLGEWGELGGLILSNVEMIDFDSKGLKFVNFDNKGFGVDWGYNHATAILAVAEKDNNLFVFDEIYQFEKTTQEIIEMANMKGYDKNLRYMCDSAEPDRIKEFRLSGFNAVGVKKYAGSVNAQIDKLKSYDKIYVNTNCVNTYKEAQQWKWKKDKDGNYIDTPVDFLDDAMAALRYSTDLFTKGNRLETMNKSILGL